VLVTNGVVTGQRNYTVIVTASGALTITTTTLPDATVSGTYNGAVQVVGGSGPYGWSVQSGNLPPGLALSGGTGASTTVSGVPTTPGFYSFVVQVSDSTGSASQALSVTVNDAPPGGVTGGGNGGGGGGGCVASTRVSLASVYVLFAVLTLLSLRRKRSA
jgi:hypothetical protein